MTCSTPVQLHLVPALPPDPTGDALDSDRSEREQSLPALGEFFGDVETVGRPAVPSRRFNRLRVLGDRGMATAEYAVGLVAACAFAAALWTIVTSGTVSGLLTGLATKALGLIP